MKLETHHFRLGDFDCLIINDGNFVMDAFPPEIFLAGASAEEIIAALIKRQKELAKDALTPELWEKILRAKTENLVAFLELFLPLGLEVFWVSEIGHQPELLVRGKEKEVVSVHWDDLFFTDIMHPGGSIMAAGPICGVPCIEVEQKNVCGEDRTLWFVDI